jgi:murein L,D-transpeptidase YafK
VLSKEEVLNLFGAYRDDAFYEDIMEHMMTAESLVLLLINKVDKVWDEERGEEVKLDTPIARWKELIGDKDPELAKNQEPLKVLPSLN